MKTLVLSILTLAVLGSSAAGAAPLRHRHHHKACSVRHHHRVCHWVWAPAPTVPRYGA